MDLSSGVYTTAYNLGFWLTPILSGAMSENFGYHFTCDFMAIFAFCFGVLFCGMLYYKKNIEKKKSKKHRHNSVPNKDLDSSIDSNKENELDSTKNSIKDC
jgi:MFS family permease